MPTLDYSYADGVARIVLDDGKVNAMSTELFKQMNACLDRALADEAGAVVFCGREDFFSAGLNVKLMPTLSAGERREMSDAFARTMLRIYALEVPTVAVVTGHAIAGGALLAFACDHRVAVDGAYRLQMNEMLIGLPLPGWAVLICEHGIAPAERTAALLHARAYSPGEALRLGMVHELVPDIGAGLDAAGRMTAEMLKLDRNAYAVTKRRMRQPAADRVLALLDDEHV